MNWRRRGCWLRTMVNRVQMLVNLCRVGCRLESNLFIQCSRDLNPISFPCACSEFLQNGACQFFCLIPFPRLLHRRFVFQCTRAHRIHPMSAVRPLRRLSVALGLTKAYNPEDCPPNDLRTHSAITADLSDFLVASKASYLKDPSAGDWTVVMGNEAGGTSPSSSF